MTDLTIQFWWHDTNFDALDMRCARYAAYHALQEQGITTLSEARQAFREYRELSLASDCIWGRVLDAVHKSLPRHGYGNGFVQVTV